MSELCRLLGNEEVVARLRAALDAGRLPHAVLLAAPDGCGRNFAARCLAADWLYPQGGKGAAAVLEGKSPEVLTLTGQGKSGQIPVDAVRAVRAEVYRSALSAAGRVVHIRDAQNMNTAAANALLKVLEEPPTDALFILTAPSPSALPYTIQSRCAVFVLTAPAAAVCRSRLQESGLSGAAENAALLTAVYDCRLGQALAVLQEEGRMAVLQDALAAAEAAGAGKHYPLLCLFARYEGRTDTDRANRTRLLGDLAAVLAACLRSTQAAGLPPLAHSAAARMLPLLTAAQAALAGNAPPKLTFTTLTLRLCQVPAAFPN